MAEPLTDADLARMEARERPHPGIVENLRRGWLAGNLLPWQQWIETLADLDLAVAEIKRLRDVCGTAATELSAIRTRWGATSELLARGELLMADLEKHYDDAMSSVRAMGAKLGEAQARIRALEEALRLERPPDGGHGAAFSFTPQSGADADPVFTCTAESPCYDCTTRARIDAALAKAGA